MQFWGSELLSLLQETRSTDAKFFSKFIVKNKAQSQLRYTKTFRLLCLRFTFCTHKLILIILYKKYISFANWKTLLYFYFTILVILNLLIHVYRQYLSIMLHLALTLGPEYFLTVERNCLQYFASRVLALRKSRERLFPLRGDNVVEADIWHSY